MLGLVRHVRPTVFSHTGPESCVVARKGAPDILHGFTDMIAFNMPFDPPAELPMPGGEGIWLEFPIPVAAVGFDISWSGPATFYGADDVVLAVLPSVFDRDRDFTFFVGYIDDQFRLIHRIELPNHAGRNPTPSGVELGPEASPGLGQFTNMQQYFFYYRRFYDECNQSHRHAALWATNGKHS